MAHFGVEMQRADQMRKTGWFPSRLRRPAIEVSSDMTAWGEESRSASFGFTGDFWHAQSGLDLTLFRAYDPSLGRWISRDPIA